MVGHTGVLDAAVKAVEVVDECVGRVVEAMLAEGGVTLVTADHGNCEMMVDPQTGGCHTAHTISPVEFIFVGDEPGNVRLSGEGAKLADAAPTVLHLLGLPVPAQMTGRNLLRA
jgi:2,3-bisphosphoglycerate-independent phosphoglycerate mutase